MKYVVTLNDKRYEVDVTETQAEILSVTAVSAQTAPAPESKTEGRVPAVLAVPTAAVTADGTPVKAPMPGTILEVKAAVGQKVKTGDVLFILEAMKMENEVVAPEDGTVKQILTGKGSTVETDSVLAVI